MTTTLAGADGGRQAGSAGHATPPQRWWTAATLALAGGIFLQAVFAGAMMSGLEWAPRAHALNAMLLTGAALAAGLVAAVTLRRVAHGWHLAVALLGLAAILIAQTALGKMAVDGANLMWVHVPLGVALPALAMRAARQTRLLRADGDRTES